MSAEHPVDRLNTDIEPLIEADPDNVDMEPAPKPSKKRKIPACLLFYIVSVLLPLVVLGFFMYQGCQKLHSLGAKLHSVQTNTQTESNSFKTNFDNYKAQSEQHDKTVQEQIEAQALQLHQLSDMHNWRISEAIYLVAIAQERLNMVHDLPTTIKLLKTAEDRLKSLGDARTSRARESIAHDIHILQTNGRFDKIGVWVELGVLRKQVENLSFHTLQGNIEGQPEVIGSESAPILKAPWKQALENTWHELKGLVKVREFNADKLNSSLEPKDQIFLLRAIDLMLIEAQWGLLEEQPVVYQQSLDRLEDKLNIYFVHDEAWKKVDEQLKTLKTKAIGPLNIDLSRTLGLLKALESMTPSSKEETVS